MHTKKSIIYSPRDIDTDNFEISDLYTNTQMLTAFIRDKSMAKPIATITSPIQITYYGIPRLDLNFWNNDTQRAYIIVPLDPKQTSCLDLRNLLEKVDVYIGSDIIKKKLFGNCWEKYAYKPMVRSNQTRYVDSSLSSEDVHTKTPQKNLPDYCKIILDNKTIIKHNSKTVATNSITDITQYVKYRCFASFIIRFHKIWAMKHPCARANNKIMYGVGLLMEEISVGYSNWNECVDYGVPIYNLDGLRQTYKKYVDENKQKSKKHMVIEI